MRAAASLVAVIGTALSLIGCGGGGGGGTSPPGQETGGVEIRIAWPQRGGPVDTQLIPAASNSIKVEITRSGQPLAGLTGIVTRPHSQWRMDGVPAGEAVLRATAYPEPDAGGVAQAKAEMSITVIAGRYTEYALTLDSAVAAVEVSPNPGAVDVGADAQFTATAKDADGQTVLVLASGAFVWSVVEGTSNATVDANGLVRGLASGRVTLRATEPESGVFGAATAGVYGWQRVGDAGPHPVELADLGGTVLALTESRLLRGEDSGTSWVDVRLGLYPPTYIDDPEGHTGRLGLYAMDVDSGSIYVAIGLGLRCDQGLALSTDGGRTFQWSFYWTWDGCTDVDFEGGVGWLVVPNAGARSTAWYHLVGGDWERSQQHPGLLPYRIKVDPSDPASVAYAAYAGYGVSGTGGCARTVDGGVNWLPCEHYVRTVLLVGGVAHAFAATAYSRDRGETWSPLGATVACVVQDEERTRLLAGTADGGIVAGQPLAWQPVGLVGKRVVSLTICGAYLFALANDGAIYRIGLSDLWPA